MKTRFCRFTLCALVVACSLPVFAQYTDSAAVDALGGPQEFTRRRTELAKELKTGYFILFARKTLPEAVHYREDNDFFYYTGLREPGAAMMMDAATGRTTIFQPAHSEREIQVLRLELPAGSCVRHYPPRPPRDEPSSGELRST